MLSNWSYLKSKDNVGIGSELSEIKTSADSATDMNPPITTIITKTAIAPFNTPKAAPNPRFFVAAFLVFKNIAPIIQDNNFHITSTTVKYTIVHTSFKTNCPKPVANAITSAELVAKSILSPATIWIIKFKSVSNEVKPLKLESISPNTPPNHDISILHNMFTTLLMVKKNTI